MRFLKEEILTNFCRIKRGLKSWKSKNNQKDLKNMLSHSYLKQWEVLMWIRNLKNYLNKDRAELILSKDRMSLLVLILQDREPVKIRKTLVCLDYLTSISWIIPPAKLGSILSSLRFRKYQKTCKEIDLSKIICMRRQQEERPNFNKRKKAEH